MAEDTRHTRKLLTHLNISNNLISLHSHNEFSRAQEVLSRLGQGETVALVCDAGMPTVSDAGVDVVAATAEAGYTVVPIPGPSASLAALAAAGLPTDEFHFVGFLPPKKAARQKQLQILTEIAATLIFFVPARSIATVVEDMTVCLGKQRKAAICRELTKVHEEILRGSLEELSQQCTARELRGEITLIVQED
ncbi:hypothetical protein WJX73_001411 [Symbiochloris irregularis]|uniref:Tetrapyrrole methylase domain-containing protein n=1 Tax=Symbiochloris irregularis TaxID=706552 RepID=A0AAW1NS24_9CHLO